ncbi:hypothetical protein HAX54_033063 [Datura stramonium]|uniref:NAD(P)H dehydrogenase subunit H n=1 Tax=Datura stramonium TaxID=4076 RepID=A0ABS8VBP5_DATST|nr:hypothetical protein [Datura stramonium]
MERCFESKNDGEYQGILSPASTDKSTKITISSIQRRELSFDIMLIDANLTLTELMQKGNSWKNESVKKLMTVPTTRKDLMIVNMGPQHPSMHGVLRLIVTLDGEDVVDCEPILGYLHRGMEKIAENRTIIQYLPYVTRWDYLATLFTEAITIMDPNN